MIRDEAVALNRFSCLFSDCIHRGNLRKLYVIVFAVKSCMTMMSCGNQRWNSRETRIWDAFWWTTCVLCSINTVSLIDNYWLRSSVENTKWRRRQNGGGVVRIATSRVPFWGGVKWTFRSHFFILFPDIYIIAGVQLLQPYHLIFLFTSTKKMAKYLRKIFEKSSLCYNVR